MMNLKFAGKLLKFAICSSLAASGSLRLYRHCRRHGTLNILMFHKVNNGRDPLGLTINPVFFTRQMQYLTEQYVVISLAEAVFRLENGTIDREYVVITFDDGYLDNYTFAYPILQRFQAPATIFITYDAVESGTFGWYRFDTAILMSQRENLDLTGFGLGYFSLASQRDREQAVVELHQSLKKVSDEDRQTVIAHVLCEYGDPGANERIMLSWDEVREMQQSGLITFGSHTKTHPILTQVPHDSALAEIRESKLLVEGKIGRPVDFFAYPNGSWADFDENIMAMVKKSGYRAACSTISAEHFTKIDMYCLPRTDITDNICRGIGGGFSHAMFSMKVSGMLDGILFRS